MAARCGRSRRASSGPAAIGQARLTLTPVREGRNVTTLAVTIEQEGTVAIARITATRAGAEGTTWEAPEPLDLYPIEACVPLYPPAGVRHFEQAHALLDPRGSSVQRRLRGADRWLRAPE